MRAYIELTELHSNTAAYTELLYQTLLENPDCFERTLEQLVDDGAVQPTLDADGSETKSAKETALERLTAYVQMHYGEGELSEAEMTAYLTNYVYPYQTTELNAEDYAYWTLKKWDKRAKYAAEHDGKTTGFSYGNYDELEETLYSGGDTTAAIEELVSHGYDEEQVMSHITSYVKKLYQGTEADGRSVDAATAKALLVGQTAIPAYIRATEAEAAAKVQEWSMLAETGMDYNDLEDAYLSGNIDEETAAQYYALYGGYTTDEAETKVRRLTMEVDTGIPYSKLKAAYYTGTITRAELVRYYQDYGDYSAEDAEAKADKLQMYMDTGVEYDDLEEAYLDGTISYVQAVEDYVAYGGLDAETAAEKVYVMDFKHEYGWTDEISYSAASTYVESVEDAGISLRDFMAFWTTKSSTHADVDENGEAISGSKKEKILAYIDGLNLTGSQKDTLYFCCDYAESKLGEAPWH